MIGRRGGLSCGRHIVDPMSTSDPDDDADYDDQVVLAYEHDGCVEYVVMHRPHPRGEPPMPEG